MLSKHNSMSRQIKLTLAEKNYGNIQKYPDEQDRLTPPDKHTVALKTTNFNEVKNYVTKNSSKLKGS